MAEDITYPEPTDKIHPLETFTWVKTSVVGNGASGEENKYDVVYVRGKESGVRLRYTAI